MKRNLSKPRNKWAFAIGTTSMVRGTNLHYLVADVDDVDVEQTLRYLVDQVGVTDLAVYPTPHGWHIYTNRVLPWGNILHILHTVPGVDQAWLRIGRRRGYLFLADYKRVKLAWSVVRMVIWRNDTT